MLNIKQYVDLLTAIIAAQTRACARLQQTERKNKKKERERSFSGKRKEHNKIKVPVEKPAIY